MVLSNNDIENKEEDDDDDDTDLFYQDEINEFNEEEWEKLFGLSGWRNSGLQ